MGNKVLSGKLALISLGCPKNQVDSEYIAGILTEAGLKIVSNKSEANYIIINTCGFIEAAIREAIDAILSATEEIGNGNLRNIIVCGCVAQRFSEELAKSIPEVDAIVGAKSYYQISEVIQYLDQLRLNKQNKELNRADLSDSISLKNDLIDIQEQVLNNGNSREDKINNVIDNINSTKNESVKSNNLKNAILINKEVDDSTTFAKTLLVKSWQKADAIAHMKSKRIVSSKNYAYLKIAEGCAHHCTYCAIPKIRGTHISRPIEDVLAEANDLINNGFKEIILVAQDLSYYGVDLYGHSKLNFLISEILKNKQLKWLRCLYLYPQAINDEFIELMKNDRRFCPYIDLPIQHASNKILKLMGRKEKKEELREIINKLRVNVPDVSLRTTVMVGFPNEDENDFIELKEFIHEIKFDHLGAFIYSAEEGTAAAKMHNQVDKKIAELRYNEIMEIQQEISYQQLKKKVNTNLEVIIENKSDDGIFYIGRSKYEAPEIDSQIYILSQIENIKLNNYYNAIIIDNDEYSLTGVIKDESIK